MWSAILLKVKTTDGWMIATDDGSFSAHFEHTIIIENGQAVIVIE